MFYMERGKWGCRLHIRAAGNLKSNSPPNMRKKIDGDAIAAVYDKERGRKEILGYATAAIELILQTLGS